MRSVLGAVRRLHFALGVSSTGWLAKTPDHFVEPALGRVIAFKRRHVSAKDGPVASYAEATTREDGPPYPARRELARRIAQRAG